MAYYDGSSIATGGGERFDRSCVGRLSCFADKRAVDSAMELIRVMSNDPCTLLKFQTARNLFMGLKIIASDALSCCFKSGFLYEH